MSDHYLITIKPAFLSEVRKLSDKEARQVYNKLYQLAQDPMPDAKVKKQLKYMVGGRKLHRIRSGDYRIFYTFDQHYISILTIYRRKEDTYDDDLDAEFLGGLATEFVVDNQQESKNVYRLPDWSQQSSLDQSQIRSFPEPITVELLHKLQIPTDYHNRLLRIFDDEALLTCPGVPEDILLKISYYMFTTPLDEVAQQCDLVLNQIEDILRCREDELLPFLLKLSPEQEQFVTRALSSGRGPTMVKGGPGTGKSTIALYRVRAMLQSLHERGLTQPRILFTTYTNALVNSSRQLLELLLGVDITYVQVQTADSLIQGLMSKQGQRKDILEGEELQRIFGEAMHEPPFEGNALQQQVQHQMLQKLGEDYLLAEICNVIEARQIASLTAYQQATRSGRRIRLNSIHRKIIWRIYERFRALVEASGKETWQMRRTRAAALVQQSNNYQAFDAVFIDEAQDLDPSALRFLVHLCKSPQHLFVTADANQSIYGSGFNWSDVHESLNFKGRTGHLHTNYRSTKEIGEASYSYLNIESLLDTEKVDSRYVHEGPLPVLCLANSDEQEILLLVHFFRRACHHLHHPLGSCALLCPGEQSGKKFALLLQQRGIEATFMAGRNLNLQQPGVKILTLHSAKGLEFPIVALAGFAESNYVKISTEGSQEEIEERLAQARRTLFVGMTRAMRALFMIIPSMRASPLMQGFDGSYWGIQQENI